MYTLILIYDPRFVLAELVNDKTGEAYSVLSFKVAADSAGCRPRDVAFALDITEARARQLREELKP